MRKINRRMTVVENSKGFKVLKFTSAEAESLHFGIPEGCICLHCNDIIPKDNIYYIAVFNDTMCEDCYKKWIKVATCYSEDIEFEEHNFNYYYNLLK